MRAPVLSMHTSLFSAHVLGVLGMHAWPCLMCACARGLNIRCVLTFASMSESAYLLASNH
jgi:hypothetical protein